MLRGGVQLSKPLAERVSSLLANFKYTKEKLERKKAFTLAEVLITLGIIGVVAAISIPTLMQNANEKDTVAKVQKAYNVMANAYKLATAEYGTIDKWGVIGEKELGYSARHNEDTPEEDRNKVFSSLDTFLNIFSEYVKFTEKNDVKTAETTASGDVYYLGGTKVSTQLTNYATFADGTMLRTLYLDRAVVCNAGRQCANFTIDVNGDKGPNTYGKDLFVFYLTKEGVFPQGRGDDAVNFSSFCNRNESHAKNGHGCAAWVVMNGNMDYLHKDGLSLGF